MNEFKSSVIILYIAAVLFDITNAYGASTDGIVNCPANYNGFVPHPLDCKLFLQCNNGIMNIYPCKPDTYYNRVTQQCDDPANVPECLPVPQISTHGHKQWKQPKTIWKEPKHGHHHHKNKLKYGLQEPTNSQEEENQPQDGWQLPSNPQEQWKKHQDGWQLPSNPQEQSKQHHAGWQQPNYSQEHRKQSEDGWQLPRNPQEQRKQHHAGWQQPSKPQQPWNHPSIEKPSLDDGNQLDQSDAVTLPSYNRYQGNQRSTVKPQGDWQQPKNSQQPWNQPPPGLWQPSKPQYPGNQPSIKNPPLDNGNQLNQRETVTLPSKNMYQGNERTTVRPQAGWRQPENPQQPGKQPPAGSWQPSKPQHPGNQPSIKNLPLDNGNQSDQPETVTLPSKNVYQGNERTTVKPQGGWQQPKNPQQPWKQPPAGSWQPSKPQYPGNQPSIKNVPLDNGNQLDRPETVTLPSKNVYQGNERTTVKPQGGWQQPKHPQQPWKQPPAGSWQPSKPQHPGNQPSIKNPPLDNGNQLDQAETVTLPSKNVDQGNERTTVKPQGGWQQPKNPQQPWKQPLAGSWQPSKPQYPGNQPSIKNPPLDNGNQLDQPETVTLPSKNEYQGNERTTVKPQGGWQQPKNPQQPWKQPPAGSWQPSKPQYPGNQPSIKNPPLDNGNQLDQPKTVTLPSKNVYQGNERTTVKPQGGWQQPKNPQQPWKQPPAGSWQPSKPQYPGNQPSIKNPPLDNGNQLDHSETVTLPSKNVYQGNERTTVKPQGGWQQPKNPQQPWKQPPAGSWQPSKPQYPGNQPSIKNPPLDNGNQLDQPETVTLPSKNVYQGNERTTVKPQGGRQQPKNPQQPWKQPPAGSWQPSKPQHPGNQPSIKNPPLDNGNQLDHPETVTLPSKNVYQGNERTTVKPQGGWQQPKNPQQPWKQPPAGSWQPSKPQYPGNQPSIKNPPLDRGNQLDQPKPVTPSSPNFYQENPRSTIKIPVNGKQDQAASNTEADC